MQFFADRIPKRLGKIALLFSIMSIKNDLETWICYSTTFAHAKKHNQEYFIHPEANSAYL